MSNPELRHHEVSDLRASADRLKCTPGGIDAGTRIHALLDAYEDREEENTEHEKAVEKLEKERNNLKDAKAELRAALTRIEAEARRASDAESAFERLAEIAGLATEALTE